MVNKMNLLPTLLRLVGLIGITVSLTACQTDWQDPTEGAAVKAAIRAQSVYPDGRPDVPTFGSGRDGVTARYSIQSYERSFVAPTGGAGGAAPAQ